jgi:phospholipid/cholesterol/gamma-HCH transport system substrate-binding protein
MIILGGSENYPEIEDGDTLLIEKTFSTEDMINILQANNVNMLAITKDIKSITHKLSNGEGSLGKLLQDDNIFSQIQSTTNSLEKASENAEIIMSSLKQLTLGLNKKGTLTHELASDTLLFKTIKNTLFTLQSISDSASIFVANLKESSINPNTPIGLLLHSKEAGDQLKVSIKNLESSSIKLNQDLEAVQHSFLLRGYFKKLQKNKSKTEK